MTDPSKYLIITTHGRQVDLTKAAVIRSNNLYPFGKHNYAVYATPDQEYVLATNSGEREIMLTTFEEITAQQAHNYRHTQQRED